MSIKIAFKTLIKISFVFLISNSCQHKINCDLEAEIFSDSWKEKVVSIQKDPNHKMVYEIKTFSGKKIRYSLMQDIIILASYGDSIIKQANCFETLLITRERDTFECNLTSPTCDKIVLKKLGFKKDKWANIVKDN